MEAMSVPLAPRHERDARTDLELISGRNDAGTPLTQGLRVVQELVNASDSVLFSILPRGLMFHAASGEDSAHLAQSLVRAAGALHAQVQGPCILGAPQDLVGETEATVLPESPVPALILAERHHRELATALALVRYGQEVPAVAARLRFAFAVFRDLTRLVRRKGRSGSAGELHAGSDAAWEKYRFAGLVGRSRQMRRLFLTVQKLAASDVNVLILGESGTGKELVARAIHDSDLYAGRKFVAQNCAALPEALLESELFGHCRGAFTGANYEKRGLFEEADNGTFFLDEIADMPLALQIKMLRVLQDGEIRRLGETRTRRVSVRIIAATNKNLAHEVAQGRFREDLYYRLHVVRLELPPLRRRREDIALLARYFCHKVFARQGRPPFRFNRDTLQRFLDYGWPGNVRELENEVERLVALHGESGEVQPYMLSERLRYGSAVDWSLESLEDIQDLHRATEYLERAMIARSLERQAWNKSRAAMELGISRQGLIKKIRRLRLVRPEPPDAVRQAQEQEALQRELPFADLQPPLVCDAAETEDCLPEEALAVAGE